MLNSLKSSHLMHPANPRYRKEIVLPDFQGGVEGKVAERWRDLPRSWSCHCMSGIHTRQPDPKASFLNCSSFVISYVNTGM